MLLCLALDETEAVCACSGPSIPRRQVLKPTARKGKVGQDSCKAGSPLPPLLPALGALRAAG